MKELIDQAAAIVKEYQANREIVIQEILDTRKLCVRSQTLLQEINQ